MKTSNGMLSQLERVETNLLTAFHKCLSPVEMRQRTHSAPLRAIELEMESLQDRVTKLEVARRSRETRARP